MDLFILGGGFLAVYGLIKNKKNLIWIGAAIVGIRFWIAWKATESPAQRSIDSGIAPP